MPRSLRCPPVVLDALGGLGELCVRLGDLGGGLSGGRMDPLPFPRPTRVLVVGMQKHGARHKKEKLFTK